jgi:hypothetical protein
MSKDDQISGQDLKQSSERPFDNIESVYVGHIVETKGTLQTDAHIVPLTMWGEVLVYGHLEDGVFVVEHLRRIALYGSVVDPYKDDPIGVLSLVGPLNQLAMDAGYTGTTHDLQLQLHYAALSSELPPRYEEEDALYPQVETIAAKLSWAQVGKSELSGVSLEIKFDANDLLDRKLGIVHTVALDPIVVPFYPIQSDGDRPAQHHSFSPHCPPPPVGPCVPTLKRRLPLRFVNLSTAADAEAICQQQIDGACEIWRNKGALDLEIEAEMIETDSDQKASYSVLERSDEFSLKTLADSNNALYATTTQVEIYVIDEFVVDHGGGYTYYGGVAEAFCILEVGLNTHHTSTARTNRNLLAHELGHVLGLAHPDGRQGSVPSSLHSVMRPGNPNPSANTLFNCRIFTDRPGEPPHNPIVMTTNQADCFRPDF